MDWGSISGSSCTSFRGWIWTVVSCGYTGWDPFGDRIGSQQCIIVILAHAHIGIVLHPGRDVWYLVERSASLFLSTLDRSDISRTRDAHADPTRDGNRKAVLAAQSVVTHQLRCRSHDQSPYRRDTASVTHGRHVATFPCLPPAAHDSKSPHLTLPTRHSLSLLVLHCTRLCRLCSPYRLSPTVVELVDRYTSLPPSWL